jgi:hypothetical protein
MAGRALDADLYVRRVREVHVVRQPVDPRPIHRRVRFPVRLQKLDLRSVGCHHGVAEHALLHGRNRGTGLCRDATVAKLARNSGVASVHGVVERDRLVGRSRDRAAHGAQHDEHHDHRERAAAQDAPDAADDECLFERDPRQKRAQHLHELDRQPWQQMRQKVERKQRGLDRDCHDTCKTQRHHRVQRGPRPPTLVDGNITGED